MGNITGALDVMSLPDVVIWLSNRARSGKRRGRVLGDDITFRDFQLKFLHRLRAEYQEVEDFFDWHYPHKEFKYTDLILNRTGLYQFVEKLRVTSESNDKLEFQCSIEQVGE